MHTKVEGMPDFKVTQGYSAETSGGIMTMVDAAVASDFMSELEQKHGQKSWIIGKVVKGTKLAKIREDVDVIEVNDSFILR